MALFNERDQAQAMAWLELGATALDGIRESLAVIAEEISRKEAKREEKKLRKKRVEDLEAEVQRLRGVIQATPTARETLCKEGNPLKLHTRPCSPRCEYPNRTQTWQV